MLVILFTLLCAEIYIIIILMFTELALDHYKTCPDGWWVGGLKVKLKLISAEAIA